MNKNQVGVINRIKEYSDGSVLSEQESRELDRLIKELELYYNNDGRVNSPNSMRKVSAIAKLLGTSRESLIWGDIEIPSVTDEVKHGKVQVTKQSDTVHIDWVSTMSGIVSGGIAGYITYMFAGFSLITFVIPLIFIILGFIGWFQPSNDSPGVRAAKNNTFYTGQKYGYFSDEYYKAKSEEEKMKILDKLDKRL